MEREKGKEEERLGRKKNTLLMYDNLTAHVQPHVQRHTRVFAGVVPWRLVRAHFLCVTEYVRVLMWMTSLCIGTGPGRISLGPVLSVLLGVAAAQSCV